MKQQISVGTRAHAAHESPVLQYRRLPRHQRMRDIMRTLSIRAQKTADAMALIAEQNWELRRFLRTLLSDTGLVAALDKVGGRHIPRMLISRIVCASQEDGPFATLESAPVAVSDELNLSTNLFVPPAQLPQRTSECLARMSHFRRCEVLGLMHHTGCFTGDFAMALLATTPAEELVSKTPSVEYDSRYIASLTRCEHKLQMAVQIIGLLSAEHPLMLVERTMHLMFGRQLLSQPLTRVWLEHRAPVYTDLLVKCGVADGPRRAPRRPIRVAR